MAGTSMKWTWQAMPALLALATTALAEVEADPDVVQRVTTGNAPGASAMAAVTPARSHQAPFELPAAMDVVWRARVTGPVALNPVVDQHGNIVVLHERGSLSQLTSRGKTAWSLRLGDAPVGTSPVLLSDGVRAVIRHDNQLLRISPSGKLLSTTPTGLKGKLQAPLPLPDGGMTVAGAGSVVRLDHGGRVTARAELAEPVLTLLRAGPAVLVISQAGKVHRFYGTGKLVSKGQLGHTLHDVAYFDSSLYAVTSDEQLIRFDLKSQTVHTLFSAPVTQPLSHQLAIGSKLVYLADVAGVVRGFSPTGTEALRAVVTDAKATPGAALGSLRSNNPLILAGKGQRVLYAQAGSETVVIDGDGGFKTVPTSACLSPTALTPLAPKRVLLSCRNGELIALGARSG